MKNRIVYLVCALIIVVTAVAIGGVIGSGMSEGSDSSGHTSTSAGTEDAEQVLVEDAYVRITYEGLAESPLLEGMAMVNFKVENLSGQEFTVYPRDSYVNDTVVILSSAVPATIAAGKSYVYPWSLFYTGVGIENFEDIEKVETKFYLMGEDGSTLETVGPFTVYAEEG